jgi:hypothetical protein
VLYVPNLGVNLLSLSLITSKNYSLSFNKNSCYIKTPTNSLLAKGSYKQGVSVFSATSSKPPDTPIRNSLLSYLRIRGIKVGCSALYTSEQNGAAGIINRVILNKVRALLFTSNSPKFLEAELIIAATYLYNRTPNNSIEFETPYFSKYKETPNLNNIRIIGSLTSYKEPSSLIKKLDPKATPDYLIGFIGDNIYKLYNPSSNRIITARYQLVILAQK